MPEWLKKNYNTLWDKYQKNEFTLEDVSLLLDLSTNMASKTLWQLENKGFVQKTRSKIDNRIKLYRLISPDDIKYIIGLYSLIEKDEYEKYTLEDKLILIDEEMKYALTGSRAAYYYHEYINPPKVYEIKINSKDEGKWMAFLTDGNTRVYLDDVMPIKAANIYVKLIHSNYDIKKIRIKTESGIYIEKIEYLILGLLDRETETSIKEIISIIIRNKNNLIFYNGGLIELASKTNNINKLGFLMSAINYESEREIISQDIINKIKEYKKETPIRIYPRDDILLKRYKELRNLLSHKSLISKNEFNKYSKTLERYEEYYTLGEEWEIIPIISRNLIQKILVDLRV